MAKALTAIAVKNLRPRAERYEVGDGGCPGLGVTVQPSGVKSWRVRFRFRGLARKLTLGPFFAGGQEPDIAPEIGAPLSLAAARMLAAKALHQVRAGVDPTAEQRKRRVAHRMTEADTLQAISEEFLRREGPRLRSITQRRSDLTLLYPRLGRLPIDQIRRGQYTRVFDQIADERGPVRADRVLAATKRLLAWHAERSDYVSVLGRGGRHTSAKERARSRVLGDDELKRIWTTAETYPGPFGAYLRFTLLTACRRSESAGVQHSELSNNGQTWTIPAAKYKSKRDTLIPLSKAAQAIIAAQPVLGDFVFSVNGTRALGGFAKRKTDFDKACGVDGWMIHDLRRTSRTLLSRCDVNADVAERCLGHAIVGVRSVYDRFEFVDQKRDAFERLARMIEHIVRPPADVANIGEARRRRQG